MKAQRLAPWLLLAATLAACSDPQTPASSSSGPASGATSTATATATVTSTATETPTVTSTLTATAPASTDKLAEPYALTYLQTGGIAGLHMELTIDTATKKVSYAGLRNNQPQTRDLTSDDLASLTRALEEARYATFHGPLKGTPFPDAFSYSLALKAGGKDYNISWTDGTTVPEPLASLRTVLVKLRDAKFPAKGTAPGAPDR